MCCWKGWELLSSWGSLCFSMRFPDLAFFFQPEAGLDKEEVAEGPCEGKCSLKARAWWCLMTCVRRVQQGWEHLGTQWRHEWERGHCQGSGQLWTPHQQHWKQRCWWPPPCLAQSLGSLSLSYSALERICPVAVGAVSPALPRSGRVSVCLSMGSTCGEVLLTTCPSWKEVQEEEQVCRR